MASDVDTATKMITDTAADDVEFISVLRLRKI